VLIFYLPSSRKDLKRARPKYDCYGDRVNATAFFRLLLQLEVEPETLTELGLVSENLFAGFLNFSSSTPPRLLDDDMIEYGVSGISLSISG
jgi:hypothetical protein